MTPNDITNTTNTANECHSPEGCRHGAKDAQPVLQTQPVLSNFLAIRHCQSDRHQTGCNWQTKAANQTRPSPLCRPRHGAAAFDCITDQNKRNISTESDMVEKKDKLVKSNLSHILKQKLAKFSKPETG